MRPRARRRAVAAAARHRRPRGRSRGGPQAGLRLDRAHVRLRRRHHRRGARRGRAVDVRVRRRDVRGPDRRTRATTSCRVLLHAEIDGDRLNQMQIAVFFMLLQNAGSETTRNLITTGMLALLERPDQLAPPARRPRRSLPVAIEELLRYATPVMSFTRTATKDTEIAGQADRRGRPRPDGVRVGEPRRARLRRARRLRPHARPQRPRRLRRRRPALLPGRAPRPARERS